MAFRESIITEGYLSFSPEHIIQRIGPPEYFLNIPAYYLHRVHGVDEYDHKQLRKLKSAYALQGINLLQNFPLIGCALPTEQHFIHMGVRNAVEAGCKFLIAVADGNHRVTAGLASSIDTFPTSIYSVSAMAEFYTYFKFVLYRFVAKESPEYTYNKLLSWIEAAEGFKQVLDFRTIQ